MGDNTDKGIINCPHCGEPLRYLGQHNNGCPGLIVAEQDNELPDVIHVHKHKESSIYAAKITTDNLVNYAGHKREMYRKEGVDPKYKRHCLEFIYGEENPEEYEGEISRLQNQVSELQQGALGPLALLTAYCMGRRDERAAGIDPALVKELPEKMMESYIGGSTGAGLYTGYDTAKLYGDILADAIDDLINESIGKQT